MSILVNKYGKNHWFLLVGIKLAEKGNEPGRICHGSKGMYERGLKEMGRIRNAIKNVEFSLLLKMISFAGKFIVRSVFIRYLAIEYLGVNGLFTNVLTILSLSELGIGSALTYNMYGAFAQDDTDSLASIMNLYAKVYRIVGIVVLSAGVLFFPVMPKLIRDSSIEQLGLIYILYIINTACSYFYSYKQSLLIVAQKEWIKSSFEIAKTIVQCLLQIWCIIAFRNFIVYLLIEVFCTFLFNFSLSFYIDKKFAWLKSKDQLGKGRIKKIMRDIKAMFMHKLGSVAVDATDNIIISFFLGIADVGIYSNYTMITQAIGSLINNVSSSLTGSIGNLNAVESRNKIYEIYLKLLFGNMLIVSGITVFLCELINPFIYLWIGKNYLLSESSVILIAVNFFIRYVMNITRNFKNTLGLFQNDKYRSLIEAVINLSTSIVLVKQIGVNGVVLGTFISSSLTYAWVEPFVLFKCGLQKSFWEYVRIYLQFVAFVLVSCVLSSGISSLANMHVSSLLLRLFIKAAICSFVMMALIPVFWKNSPEFKYYVNKMKGLIKSR